MEKRKQKLCTNCDFYELRVNDLGWKWHICTSPRAHRGNINYDVGRNAKACGFYRTRLKNLYKLRKDKIDA